MKKKYPIVFICGLGGTGKSTLADKLKKILPIECNIFRLDWYLKYSTSERKFRIREAMKSGDEDLIEKEVNPVNWNDFAKFNKDLLHLQRKAKLDLKSVWNQQTGEKDSNIKIRFENPKGLIICEGIYLLHPKVAAIADYIILLDITEAGAIERMTQRDSHRNSKEYLELKAKLQKEYDVPYFKKHKHAADKIIEQTEGAYMKNDQIQEIVDLIQNRIKENR